MTSILGNVSASMKRISFRFFPDSLFLRLSVLSPFEPLFFVSLRVLLHSTLMIKHGSISESSTAAILVLGLFQNISRYRIHQVSLFDAQSFRQEDTVEK